MLAGIREILIITHARGSVPRRSARCSATAADVGHLARATPSSNPSRSGLAQAFLIGADFVGSRSVSV